MTACPSVHSSTAECLLVEEVSYTEVVVGRSGETKIMLIGQYFHTLDDKKRLALPSKFRKEIGKKVVITHGLDNCLFVFTVSGWEEIASRLSSLSIGSSEQRSFSRFMLAGAVETDVDSAGRILVPDFLKEYASLGEKVVVTGVHSRIEIWEETRWSEYKGKVAREADSLAEKLGTIGVI